MLSLLPWWCMAARSIAKTAHARAGDCQVPSPLRGEGEDEGEPVGCGAGFGVGVSLVGIRRAGEGDRGGVLVMLSAARALARSILSGNACGHPLVEGGAVYAGGPCPAERDAVAAM